MSKPEITTNEIFEFLQENMLTREDGKDFATKKDLIAANITFDKVVTKVIEIDERLDTFATKNDLMAVKTEIVTTIDRFAKLHETLDQELVVTRNRYDRLEARLEIVEAKLGLAS